MYRVKTSKQYKKDFKRILSDKSLVNDLEHVIGLLYANDNPLPEKYQDHKLKGNYANVRECHVRPDWLLVYRKDKTDLILLLIGTGSHSYLFG
jgi:mRNA interferase YafQ